MIYANMIHCYLTSVFDCELHNYWVNLLTDRQTKNITSLAKEVTIDENSILNNLEFVKEKIIISETCMHKCLC